MKIAICFSGQPRNVRKCYKIISDSLLKNDHEVDVFAHMWWDSSYKNEIIRFEMNDRYLEDEGEVFKHLYKPKSLILEKQKQFDVSSFANSGITNSSFETKVSAFNNLSMWHSIKRSFELSQESGKDYDLYVRCRTDLVFIDDVSWASLNPEILYVGDGRIAGFDRHYGDWFAVSGLVGMQKYVSIGDRFEELNSSNMMHMHHFMSLTLGLLGVRLDNDKFCPELSMMIPEINVCLDSEGMIDTEKFRNLWRNGQLRDSLESIPVSKYENFEDSMLPHYWKKGERF